MPDKKRLIIPLVVVVLDQLSKVWLWRLDRGVLNQSEMWWMVMVVLVWVGLTYAYLKATKNQWGMGLIVGAGLANLLDRLILGGVRDFIYYPGLNVYGNIADIILGIGVAGFIWPWKKRNH